VDVEDGDHVISRDLKTKQVTSEALDQIQTRFFEVAKYSDSLDSDEKNAYLSARRMN
jgi:hypothetical protein